MSEIDSRMEGILEEAEYAFNKGHEFSSAQSELENEFPNPFTNIFRVFLDYGPDLFELFIDSERRFDEIEETIPPASLKRFSRVLLVSYSFYNNESRELARKRLSDLFDRMESERSHWTTTTRGETASVGTDEYIQAAARLRALVNELAEVEFLSEQNWSFWTYESKKTQTGTHCEFKFRDLNPLDTTTRIPNMTIYIRYNTNKELTYGEFLGGYDELPPVTEISRAAVEVDDKTISHERISDITDTVRDRLFNARSAFQQMPNPSLHFAKCHLMPIYLIEGMDWEEIRTESQPPFDRIVDSISNRRYSNNYGESELFVFKYFEALVKGTEKILE